MRVVTWNCNGRFRDKITRALWLEADITIIQEAENPALYVDLLPGPWVWTDAGRGKGLLTYATQGWALGRDLDAPAKPSFKYVVPMRAFTPRGDALAVWAVWCMDAHRKADAWVAQLHRALDSMTGLIHAPIVIAGDLNSNVIWDRDRKLNHSRLTERLAERGILSAYHEATGEEGGQETQPTFWSARSEYKPFHIDYVFSDLPARSAVIGSYSAWSGPTAAGGVSDHAPLVVDFNCHPTSRRH